MAGKFHFGLTLLFTVMTLLTIGVAAVVFGFMIYYFKKMAVHEASNGLYAALIIGLCVSILILIYGTYASCCGAKCHKILICILYSLFSVALLALGVYMLAAKSQLMDLLSQAWSSSEGFLAVETELNCSGWSVATNNTRPTKCEEVIGNYYDKYGKLGGGVFIVLGVLLFGGVILAFKIICRKNKGDERGSSQQGSDRNQFTTPLHYGW